MFTCVGLRCETLCASTPMAAKAANTAKKTRSHVGGLAPRAARGLLADVPDGNSFRTAQWLTADIVGGPTATIRGRAFMLANRVLDR